MPRDYKGYSGSKSRRRSSGGGRKSRLVLWIALLVLIAIFAVALYWLSQHRLARHAAVTPKTATPAAAAPVAPAKPKIQFDFYNLLPKETVGAIKDTEANAPTVPANNPDKKAAPSATTTPSAPSAKPATAPVNKESYMLQIASIKNFADADALKAKLTLGGYSVKVITITVSGNTWYRVLVGPYATSAAASKAQADLRQQHYEGIIRKAE